VGKLSATSEVLNKAADIIEHQGWRQNKGMCPNLGPKCIMGGIGQAIEAPYNDFDELGVSYSYGVVEKSGAYQAVLEHIGEENVGGPWLYVWNDHPARTAEDVIGALRAAAVIESAREAERLPVR